MASIRRLKKNIDYLTFAVIDDCVNCLAYGKNTDDISEIVQNTIDLRNSVRQRVNAGRKVVKNERKAYFQTVAKDFMAAVDGAFSKLSDLVKKD